MAKKSVIPAEALLIKARAALIQYQPFFGNLALRLKFVAVHDPKECDTAAVDGVHFFYHPPFVEELKQPELEGLVCHEVLHCVFQHMQRGVGRQPRRWNVACDYTINQHVLDNQMVLPQGAITDPTGKYKDWSAEAIYNDLPPDPEPPKWGFVLDPAGDAGSAIAAEWEIAARVSAQMAKQAGKLPGSLEGMLEEFLEPVMDWKAILWPFVANLSNEDHSWSKPHRAYIGEDIYLPSMRSETLGALAFVIDTSGSVSDQRVQQAWSEIMAVAQFEKPSKLVVIQCDSAVQSCEEIDIDNFGDFQVSVKGRGGTRFSPAFKHLAENYDDLEAIVYLTDMECSDYGADPELPVLWISTEKKWQEPPFGEVTYMPEK